MKIKTVYFALLILGLVSLGLLTQCEPCETCGDLVDNPYITVEISPTDSLARLRTTRTSANTESTRLAGLISDFTDPEEIDSLQTLLDSVDAYLAILNARVDVFNTQGVRVDTVRAVGTDLYFVNLDTAEGIRLPLDLNADSSTWAIQLFGTYDTLQVFYQLREEQLEDFRLVVIADSVQTLRVQDYSYDTAFVLFGDPARTATEALIRAEK